MKRNEKEQIVAELVDTFNNNNYVYLASTDGLSANDTNALRRLLFENGVSMRMVKNTLVKRAMESSEKDFGELLGTLAGTTCVMVSENIKAPAKSIKKFRESSDQPVLKGAWVDSSVFIGDDQIDALVNIKSKEDLIGEIVTLLQSPIKNVIGGLQANGGQKIAGLVKALSEKE